MRGYANGEGKVTNLKYPDLRVNHSDLSHIGYPEVEPFHQ
jgi:hypothetical protein